MIRILHIQKVTAIAGSERHLLTLIPRLDRTRFATTMLVLEEPSRPADGFASEMAGAGVRVLRQPIRHDVDFTCWRQLRRRLAADRADIVHTHLIHADLYGLSAAATLRPRPVTVSSKHGYDNYERTSAFYQLSGWLNPAVDAVVTISDALQQKVAAAEGLPIAKMQTVHYGLDVGPANARHGSADRLRLVTVGRLVPVKGFEYLIRAIAELGPRGHDVSLTIVGDGPERSQLEALALDLGVADRIQFAGWQSDVRSFLDSADVFVLPTLGEGFGLSILEAMGRGLPVISTDTMAIPEIVIDGQTGRLVSTKDPVALAGAIRELLERPAWRVELGRAGHARATAMFSVDRMVERFEALYDGLMARSRATSG
jgi:glycosyltransferase involved in cell wall biosynthesis